MGKWLFCAIAVYACGDTDPQRPDEPPRLELGTGSFRFEALENGEEVELVHGAQGGFHIWISLRVTGAEVDTPEVDLVMQPVDRSLPRQQVSAVFPFEDPDEHGARKLIGYTGVVNDPSCWVGHLVRVQATLRTDNGAVLHDQRDLVLLGGVYPPPPCGSRCIIELAPR